MTHEAMDERGRIIREVAVVEPLLEKLLVDLKELSPPSPASPQRQHRHHRRMKRRAAVS